MFDTEIIEDERQGLPSASGMQRLFLCPGSWNAERKCPVDEESDDAALGTMLHVHMEQGTMPEDPEDEVVPPTTFAFIEVSAFRMASWKVRVSRRNSCI